ncbi:IS256 family transposase [Idiomarina tyrosinivorans]|uniref:Mutator family transposase n=1 Tax=Idiomarina tyrosinivorans TaxID=1445662 RepID=A0A432ZTU4_9GAMM|nr:IS256 family transposase [Idiomarina tyrosinivorans]RUO81309.1 IS256 family transposase [Idiomarina tyrosinivorans]
MTCDIQDRSIGDVLELLIEQGLDGTAEAISILLNEAMRLERERHLGAGPWERSEERQGYANGYKKKALQSRFGKLDLNIPQTRDTDFYPSSLERGLRSEKALKLALAEMYVQGVSTRKVARVTEELCGFEISSTQVSRAAHELDVHLQQWRERPLGSFPYVVLDARYEKVRHGGSVIDCAVLVAMGVNESGHRELLGCSVSLSEQEVHWRDFLLSLKDRGLHGMKLFVSDAHEGLKAARKSVFPSVPWQRCQFHLQQNAQSYVPKQAMKTQVADDIRSVFDAKTPEEAKRHIELLCKKYEQSAPKLAAWAETALPEGLAILALPAGHRRRLRTTNALERVNKEIKRRTRVATLFPNEASCLRLVTAVIMEISDEWSSGKKYLTMDGAE